MIHTLIVPGVGGSEYNHWQSWLQHRLIRCSRVQQKDWNRPLLDTWVAEFVKTLQALPDEIQIVAHSFGCLTSVAALDRYPELNRKIRNLVLVAPANPARFGENGFSRDGQSDYRCYFQQIQPRVPATLLISENDPWLGFADAQILAEAWKIKPVNLGAVGHVNVASGFGPFPGIEPYLIPEQTMQPGNQPADQKYDFKFAF